jgi:DNA helicase HerA-like ATPase
VSVYLVSQNPLDIPESVLRPLGNRVQLSWSAFTPKDQKAVKAGAETFRVNPTLNVEKTIGELERARRAWWSARSFALREGRSGLSLLSSAPR